MTQLTTEILNSPRGPAVSRRNLAAGFGVLVSAMVVPKTAKALCIGPICIGGGGGGGGGGEGQCFVRGTRILTPTGEIEIEKLQPGDLVSTAFGDAKPIKWIGRRAISAEEMQAAPECLPVRVCKFSLSDTAPHRDLYLSRGHSIFVDGVLAPAGDFINGRSITQCPQPDVGALEYYHIELQYHDVIFAEGAPCETLLVKNADALLFDNAVERANDGGMTPIAQSVGLKGRKSELKSRMRSAFSPLVDRRTRFDLIRDRLEERALMWPRAA